MLLEMKAAFNKSKYPHLAASYERRSCLALILYFYLTVVMTTLSVPPNELLKLGDNELCAFDFIIQYRKASLNTKNQITRRRNIFIFLQIVD